MKSKNVSCIVQRRREYQIWQLRVFEKTKNPVIHIARPASAFSALKCAVFFFFNINVCRVPYSKHSPQDTFLLAAIKSPTVKKLPFFHCQQYICSFAFLGIEMQLQCALFCVPSIFCRPSILPCSPPPKFFAWAKLYAQQIDPRIRLFQQQVKSNIDG